MEDSREGLFVEPNAYIQNQNVKSKKITKVVFQEPYDSLPNFYLDNNFAKRDCDCVNKCKHPKTENKKCEIKNNCENKSTFPFDIKSLLPLLNLFNKGGTDISSVLNIFSKDNSNGLSQISSLLGNGDLLTNISKMFSKKDSKTQNKEELVITDYKIKNYTKV